MGTMLRLDGPRYQCVLPSLVCFFNRGNTEGTNSSTIWCLVSVYDCRFSLIQICVRTDFVDFREFVV